MALQTKKRTKSSKKRRASHFALKKQNLTACPKCGKPLKPHTVCGFCGTYKNKKVLDIKSKKIKKTPKEKKQEKE